MVEELAGRIQTGSFFRARWDEVQRSREGSLDRANCSRNGRFSSREGGGIRQQLSAGWGFLVAANFGDVSTYQSSSILSLTLWFSTHSVLLLAKALPRIVGNLCMGTATPLGCPWKNKGRPRTHPLDAWFWKPHSDVCFLNKNPMFVTCTI